MAAAWVEAARERLHLQDPKRLLGLGFILAVAVIWVLASFIVQDIEHTGVNPAVLTLIANSLFAIYLPVHYANLRIQSARRAAMAAAAAAEYAALFPAGTLQSEEDAADEALPMPAPLPVEGEDSSKPLGHDMSRRQLLVAASIVAPLWYLAQLTFNMSLLSTSVTSNTILSSTSALFTFLFSLWLLAEVFTLMKLGSIGLLIAGTAMVTLADSQVSQGGGGGSNSSSVAGDLLCLLSAVIYGAYTVAIRKLLREDEDTSMTLFFGFMGALILGVVGPLVLLAWALGAPLGSLSWRQFGMVVAKGLLDNVLSDYLWARAILLIGPTIATGGLSMQVPLAVVLDAIVRSPPWLHSAGTAVLTFLGAAVILAGFFGLNSGEADDERGRAERWEERQAALQTELGMGEDEEDGLSLDGGGFGSSGSLAGAAAAADGGGYHVAHRAEGGEGEGQGLADLRSR